MLGRTGCLCKMSHRETQPLLKMLPRRGSGEGIPDLLLLLSCNLCQYLPPAEPKLGHPGHAVLWGQPPGVQSRAENGKG